MDAGIGINANAIFLRNLAHAVGQIISLLTRRQGQLDIFDNGQRLKQ